MDVRKEAKALAVIAHQGQYRRYKHVPAVSHPEAVSLLISTMNAEETENLDILAAENLEAASDLHDVPEDSKYTIVYIYKMFGRDIAYLVYTASERKTILRPQRENKCSWVERKQDAIERTRYLPLRNKHLICADKIHNICCLIQEFTEKGKADWSLYNAKCDEQLWFFNSIYNSLIEDEDPNDIFFWMLRYVIDELMEICQVSRFDVPKSLEIKYG